MTEASAFSLTGAVQPHESVRIKGGRTLYEQVGYSWGADRCLLMRLDTSHGLRVVRRYVSPETVLEIVPDLDNR